MAVVTAIGLLLTGCSAPNDSSPQPAPTTAAKTTSPGKTSPPAPKPVEVRFYLNDSDWSGDQDAQALIKAVEQQLNDRTGWRRAGLTFVGNGGPDALMQVKLLAPDKIYDANVVGRCFSPQIGCATPGTDPNRGSCFMTLLTKQDSRKRVVLPPVAFSMHEVGHCFGIPHQRKGLMRSSVNVKERPTAAHINLAKSRLKRAGDDLGKLFVRTKTTTG